MTPGIRDDKGEVRAPNNQDQLYRFAELSVTERPEVSPKPEMKKHQNSHSAAL